MPFVERDQDGKIKGIYANPQPGYAEEFLAGDKAEVVAYLNPPTPSKPIDGVTFLSRVTDDEYLAITAAGRTNGQIGKWIEMLRLRGDIDVSGTTAQAAKAGLVAAGLLTQDRADVIFANG
jgi:hypothetical protein